MCVGKWSFSDRVSDRRKGFTGGEVLMLSTPLEPLSRHHKPHSTTIIRPNNNNNNDENSNNNNRRAFLTTSQRAQFALETARVWFHVYWLSGILYFSEACFVEYALPAAERSWPAHWQTNFYKIMTSGPSSEKSPNFSHALETL